MKKNKTQQFSRFFLKDIKSRDSKHNDDKFDIDEFSFYSSR